MAVAAEAKPSPSPKPTPIPFVKWTRHVLSSITPQQVWATGHLVTVLFALFYTIASLTLSDSPFSKAGWWTALAYRIAFIGTLTSYGVILYKSHGIPHITPGLEANPAYAQKIALDENTQYLLLAFVWLFSRPLILLLLPFATFSTFHSLAFVKSDLLPLLYQSSKAASASSSVTDASQSTKEGEASLKKWTSLLTGLITKYQNPAMAAVAFLEVWITLPALLICLFLSWSSFLQLIVFAQFLRFRCWLSPIAKASAVRLGQVYDALVAKSTFLPQGTRVLLSKAKEFVIQYGDLARQAQAPPPATDKSD